MVAISCHGRYSKSSLKNIAYNYKQVNTSYTLCYNAFMHLIRIIPIARGIAKEELSYFSRENITPGTLVTVPVRRREVPGLVVSSSLVRDVKAEVRTAAFALRKLKAQKNTGIVSEAFVRAASFTADVHATSTGAVLYQTIPQAILTTPVKIHQDSANKPKPYGHEVRVLQAERAERYAEYKNSVRETFARHGSVLLVAPTVREAELLHEVIGRGIESYTYLLTSALTKKTLTATWKKALNETHTVLIIATPGSISIPRHDLATIIIEREQSSLYRLIGRATADVRVMLDALARELSIRMIRADLPISVESAYRLKRGMYISHPKTPPRIHFESTTALIDMRTKPSASEKSSFKIFSDELIDTTHDVLAHGGHVFLFAVRRGLAATTVCQDCGTTVTCRVCGASVSLHGAHEHNMFLCHSCGASRDAHERCTNCSSWRLVALGVGIERVVEEAQKRFPTARILRIDRDSTHTKTQAQKTAASFFKTPASILIGTEMALTYLDDQADFTAVVSLDTLLSLPAWNIYEKIFSLLTRLREHTHSLLLIQTRHTQARVLDDALTLNLSHFFAEELHDRQQFSYPPFSVLIKVTTMGIKAQATKTMEQAIELLQPFGFVALPHLAVTQKGVHALHGFLRVKADTWPNPDLVAVLRALPPSLLVEVNPERIL